MGTCRHPLARHRRALATATILLAVGTLGGCGGVGQLITGSGGTRSSAAPATSEPATAENTSAMSTQTPSAATEDPSSAPTTAPTTGDATPSATTDNSSAAPGTPGGGPEVETLILPNENVPIGDATSRNVQYPEDIVGTSNYSDLNYTLDFSYSVPGLPAACEKAVSVVDNFRSPAKEFAIASLQGTWPTQAGQDANLVIMAVRSEEKDEVMKLYDNIAEKCEPYVYENFTSDAEPFWDGSGTHVWVKDDAGNRVDIYGGGVEEDDLHVVVIAMGLSESDAAALFEAQQEHFENVAPTLS